MKKGPQIFAGAVEIFSEKGFDNATMDQVAERAGVAKGTLYYHFSGKEELIYYMIQEGVDLLMEHLQEIPRTDGARIRLEKVIETHVKFFEDNRAFCKVLVTAIWADATRYAQFRQSLQLLYGYLASILDEGIYEGTFKKTGPVEWMASSLFGMTAVTCLRIIMDEKPIPIKQMSQFITQQFLEGLLQHHQENP